MVQTITTLADFEKLVMPESFAIVDFFAPWCGPCQVLAPTFAAAEKEFGSACSFFKSNVDDAEDLAIKFGISSIPTIIFFKSGREAFRVVGGLGADALAAKIRQLQAS